MTLFETVYDLLSEDDHAALRRVLENQCASAAADDDDLQEHCRPSGTGDSEAAAVDCVLQDLFLVCRMNAASSTRRVSSVSSKPYRPKVSASFLP